MKRLFKNIVFAFSLLLALLTAASYFQSYMSPEKIRQIAFLGFAFQYLWCLSLLLFLVTIGVGLFRSSVVLFLSLAATFAGITNEIKPWPSVVKKTNSETLTIVTLNVCGFKNKGNDKQAEIAKELKTFIDSVEADIVCLQEMPRKGTFDKFTKSTLEKYFGFKYVAYDNYSSNKGSSVFQIVMSNYPMRVGNSFGTSDLDSHIMPLVVEVGNRDIAILNCHLESIRLSDKQISSVNNAIHARREKDNLKSTYKQMMDAFTQRAVQARKIRQLVSENDCPTIVCGDFNDIPTSYTYKQVTTDLKDAFEVADIGIGDTFNGNLPPLRIDHILHSKGLQAVEYKVNKSSEMSDHFAVMARFVIE
ncbi:MAG: endonuclease/exonuclease/phosphatase family protein [Bacteroidales bacterium]|nr:endonuclease/exonuclease/phosphatase family protein [Bacteroidales bacterium]